MKLGIAMNIPHSTPEEWAKKHSEIGLEAVVFPCGHTEKVSVIDAYKAAADRYNITIAEVGAWCNPMYGEDSEENIDNCIKQLELAEYVGANCCVNIAGAMGEVWDGAYAENYSDKTYEKIIDVTQRIIDAVKPKNTFYTLEPMPYIYPDSPECYLKLIKDIDRKGFGVHMDIVNMLNSPKRYFENSSFTAHCFDLLGEHTKSCHIKDCKLENKLTLSITETECGNGGFDIARFIAEADKVSHDMPVIIEHLSEIEKYFEAIKYIRGLGL